ncbi:hypothetical protein CMV_005809 [Castanea mollissima]|uniref:BED-type domain-containing protein n=1 Tax=Castanea mollissima TaxID=60419 RepID=A0A8J4RBW5_9ROSI|nr:hypothetical protein CMV_005809 [Castanea mollissima]
MGRQRDQFWDHAEKLNDGFICNYCEKEFTGGATRIKAHLAGIPGHDIQACNAVPQDVQEKAQATQKKRETQGKEEYRAEIILNDVMDRLIANVSSLATEHINFELSFKVDLLETLFKIRFVLGDAQKRQSSDESMGIWLTELRNVAYDADNVVDKFCYESFWQKVRIQNQMMDQVCNFSLCNFDKLKTIKQLLDTIVNDVANSGLRMELVNSIPKISLDVNIDSLLDDLEVVGRKDDIKKIVNLLINSNNQQDEGYRIKELGCLKNLKGEINIYNLENVEDKEEAKSAKLKEKEIFKLGLNWNYSRVEDSYDKDVKVLEGLQPHPNLKSLTIRSYGGKKFPSWVGLSSLYHNLIEIKLRYCMECEEVPTLGQLPCLRVLEITGMRKVRCIGSEFYFYTDGSYRDTTTLFPTLRILKLVEMETLEEWRDAKELTTTDEVLFVFPCLEELSIGFCNKLRYLPDSLRTCVSLQKLVVRHCPELSSLPGVRSLQKLVVEYCPNLMSLPGVGSIIRRGIEDPPNGLQCVIYSENGDFRLPSTSSIHPSLQKLRLKFSGPLLLDQIQYFIALKILWIQGSYEMVALPEWFGNLSFLQELYLLNCWNLVHLPTEEAMRRLIQLKTLIIYRCPKLEDNEQIKISHVPWVKIINGYQ